jgi:cyanate permease
MEITKEDLQTSSVQIEDAIPRESGKEKVVGTVKLIEDGELVLIPIPTADPRDPLNLPEWRKVLIVINVSIFAATATLIASSFGAILPVINKEYDNDPRVNDLVTFPALFIGLGNLLFVPVAHAIGRRPVYLFSLLMLIACCVGCACSKSLSAHIAARDLLGLAAGQAEALCPIMIQVRRPVSA